jgi:hypothetical protein
MKQHVIMSLMLASTLALSGCGTGGNNSGTGAAATVRNEPTAAANAAAPEFSGPAPVAGVTRDFLVGSWATDSCEAPSVIYGADGTTDGGRRRWTLDGDRLIVSRGGEREQSVVERLGDDRMRLNTRDGPFELRRCPAAQR